MSRDSSGNYTLPAGVNPVVAGTTITDDWANTTLQDVATGLTDSWDRSGRGAPLANLSMGSFKFTTMAAGSASTDSIRYGQAVNQDSTTIASGSTVDLVTNLQSDVTISGTTTITSFGTGAAAGVRKFVTFTGALTLTHSSTLICPGATNISIAAGDSIELRSEGSNVWRVVNYQSGGGLSTRLNQLASATAANTLANSNYKQTWGWSSLGGSDIGLDLQGTSGSSLGTLLKLSGTCQFLAEATSATVTNRIFAVAPSGQVTINSGATNTGAGNGASVTVNGVSSAASSGGTGGSVNVSGGSGDGAGNGGSIVLTGGSKGGSGAQGSISMLTAASESTLLLSGTALTLGGSTKLVLNQKHTYVDNTNGAPTITAGGGTGVTIAGSDVAFEVIAGTGSPTSFTATFANAWATAPQIVLTGCSQAGVRLSYTATTTTVQISTDVAWSSGAKISVLCLGLQ